MKRRRNGDEVRWMLNTGSLDAQYAKEIWGSNKDL